MIKTIIIASLFFTTFLYSGILDNIKNFFDISIEEDYAEEISEESISSEESSLCEEQKQEEEKEETKLNLTNSTLQLCDITINDYIENLINQAVEDKEALLSKIIQEHKNEAFWPLLVKAALKKRALSTKDFLWVLDENNTNKNKLLDIFFSLDEDFSYLFEEINIPKEHYLSTSLLTYMRVDSHNEKQNLLVYLIENSHHKIFFKLLIKFPNLFSIMNTQKNVIREEFKNGSYEEKSYTFFEWILRKEQIYLKLSSYAHKKSNNYVITGQNIIKFLLEQNIIIDNKNLQLIATVLLQEQSISLEEFNKLNISIDI